MSEVKKTLEKNEKRIRLSVDLEAEAHADVKEMLLAAAEATGKSTTELTIRALRNQLPTVVQQLREETEAGAKKFKAKYGGGDASAKVSRAADKVEEQLHRKIVSGRTPST